MYKCYNSSMLRILKNFFLNILFVLISYPVIADENPYIFIDNNAQLLVKTLQENKELFKSDGVVREGFIAHEVQEVIPSGADGAKDEEDCIQSLRVDAIVAVLTKAVQEQQVLIESLTTRVEQLETN